MLVVAYAGARRDPARGRPDAGGSLLAAGRRCRWCRRSARTVRTRTDGPSLNAALAATGRLLAVFSLLLSAGVLLS